jgi:hypothetical protein
MARRREGSVSPEAAIVGEGTAHGAAIAPEHLGCRLAPALALPFHGPDTADRLCACFFGRTIGCRDGRGSLAESMAVTPLVRDRGPGVLAGLTDRGLAVPAYRHQGHAQGVLDPVQECGEVGVSSRQQALSQQDFTRATVTDAPEDCMTASGLEAIEGQDDPALGLGKVPEATGVLEREAAPCIVALQEGADRALRHRHPLVDQGVMDCGETAVRGRALGPHEGHDLEAARVLGQGEVAFGFRPRGFAHLRAVGGETAAHLQGELQDGLQGREGAGGVRGSPQSGTTVRTVTVQREQGLGGR